MDIIKLLPEWAVTVGVIIMLLSVVAGLFFIGFLLLKKRGSLKLGILSLQPNQAENLGLIFMEGVRVAIEKREIEIKIRFDEMEEYAKTMIDGIMTVIMENYARVLKLKNIDNPMESKYYKQYGQNIKLTLDDMQRLCNINFDSLLKRYDAIMELKIKEKIEELKRDKKRYDLQNWKDALVTVDDLYSLVACEYEKYKQEKADEHIDAAIKKITREWIETSIITRDETHKESLCIIDDIKTRIKEVYRQAINIYLFYFKRLKELDREYKNSIKKIVNSESIQ